MTEVRDTNEPSDPCRILALGQNNEERIAA